MIKSSGLDEAKDYGLKGALLGGYLVSGYGGKIETLKDAIKDAVQQHEEYVASKGFAKPRKFKLDLKRSGKASFKGYVKGSLRSGIPAGIATGAVAALYGLLQKKGSCMNSKVLADRLVKFAFDKESQQKLIGQAAKSSLFSKLVKRLAGVADKAKAGGKRYVELLQGGNPKVVGGYKKTLSSIRAAMSEALSRRDMDSFDKLNKLYAEIWVGSRVPNAFSVVDRFPGATVAKKTELARELAKADLTRTGTVVGGVAGASSLLGGKHSESVPKAASVKKAGAGRGVVNILKGIGQLGVGLGQTGAAAANLTAKGLYHAGRGASRYGSLLTGFRGNMLDRKWKALSRAGKPFADVRPVADASKKEWTKVWLTRLLTLAGLGGGAAAVVNDEDFD